MGPVETTPAPDRPPPTRSGTPKLSRWRRWAGTGAASVGEQALFAGTHLLVNILLARWLPIEEYGTFALVYSVIVFLNALHTAMVAEPVAIFWQGNADGARAFLSEAWALNLAFTVLTVAIGVAGAAMLAVLNILPFQTMLLVPLLAISLPLLWFVRQVAYADLRPWSAVAYTGIYAGGFVLGTLALRNAAVLDVGSTLIVMALAAILASFWGFGRYWTRPSTPFATGAGRFAAKAWAYGRWSAPTGVLMWIANNVFILVLPLASTVADAGRLKMVLNILLPFQQVLLGLSLIGLPMLARLYSGGEFARAARLTRIALTVAVVGGGIFGVVLAVGGEVAFAWIYGLRRAEDAPLVLYGLGLPLTWSIIAVLRVVLRARGDSRSTFVGYAVGLATVGIAAVPLGAFNGAAGALVGSTAIAAAIAAVLCWRCTKLKLNPSLKD